MTWLLQCITWALEDHLKISTDPECSDIGSDAHVTVTQAVLVISNFQGAIQSIVYDLLSLHSIGPD